MDIFLYFRPTDAFRANNSRRRDHPSSSTPSQPSSSRDTSNKENDSPLPKYKRDLVQKMKVLRQELQAMQPQAGHCRVEVSREEIFEVKFYSFFSSFFKVIYFVTK